jgi:hypothetical protein
MIERCKQSCKVFGNFVDFRAKNSCFFILRAFFCSSENPVLNDVALHKKQGQICSKLIVDLNHRPFIPQITFPGLYVAVSRVRRREDLRIMPIQPNSRNLIFLTTLQLSQKLVNAYGDWDSRRIQTDPLPISVATQRKTRIKASKRPASSALLTHTQHYNSLVRIAF